MNSSPGRCPGKNRLSHHQRDGADIPTRLRSDGALTLDPPGLVLEAAALIT